jgi:hypothetical protein
MKVALITILTLFSVLMLILGLCGWISAKPTTRTQFDVLATVLTDEMPCICRYAPWVDKEFLKRRASAGFVLYCGVSAFGWVIVLVKSQRLTSMMTLPANRKDN